MPLSYTPDPLASSTTRDPLLPGTYVFKVDRAEEKTFSTGARGLSVKLLVDFKGRDVTCFTNLFYDKVTWKLKSFLECVGLDYGSPPELFEIEGRFGEAKFVIKDNYFEVATFLSGVDKALKPKAPSAGNGKAHIKEDDVPF